MQSIFRTESTAKNSTEDRPHGAHPSTDGPAIFNILILIFDLTCTTIDLISGKVGSLAPDFSKNANFRLQICNHFCKTK